MNRNPFGDQIAMNPGRHVVGTGFLLIGALCYLTNHAVIAGCAYRLTSYGTPPGRWGTAAEAFSSPTLIGLSLAALVLGVLYLIWAESIRPEQQKTTKGNP